MSATTPPSTPPSIAPTGHAETANCFAAQVLETVPQSCRLLSTGASTDEMAQRLYPEMSPDALATTTWRMSMHDGAVGFSGDGTSSGSCNAPLVGSILIVASSASASIQTGKFSGRGS